MDSSSTSCGPGSAPRRGPVIGLPAGLWGAGSAGDAAARRLPHRPRFLWESWKNSGRHGLLLFGILFLILPGAGFGRAGKSGEVEVVEVSFHFLAGVLFFILLMLGWEAAS